MPCNIEGINQCVRELTASVIQKM